MSLNSLHDVFYYDETSPSCLRWKVDRFVGRYGLILRARAGDIAGCRHNKGYYAVKYEGKKYMCHRIIFSIFNPTVKLNGLEIDHEDRVRSNNHISNLRLVTSSGNKRNSSKHKNNTSGFSGVKNHLDKYWVAFWSNLDRKQCQKYFSVIDHGWDNAFRLACEYREKMIKELNLLGAGYTDTHGQEGAYV